MGGKVPRRDRVFGFVYLLLSANALLPYAVQAAEQRGLALALLNLFDISAIIWLAAGAMLGLLWQGQTTARLRPADLGALSAAIVAAMVPLPPLSALALTFLAGWSLATSPRRSLAWRAAAIALSLSGFMLWGRIVLAAGAGPLLAADARFVGLLSGLPVQGNLVSFIDGRSFMIAPGCSSLHGLSLAVILWTTAVMWFDLQLGRRLWLTLLAALAATVLVNGLRLATIAYHPADFDYWHLGTGAALFGWLALLGSGSVVYAGLRGAVGMKR